MAILIGLEKILVDKSQKHPMRFLCFGMGAIGTYIGGSLLLAGYHVDFLERPESVVRAKTSGLTLGLPNGLHTIKDVSVYSTLAEATQNNQYDVALVAVKSFDTRSVVENIRSCQYHFPTVVCLQNGVENEAAYESVLGKDRVIGASIATAVSKDGIGKVNVEKMRGIGIESSNSLSEEIILAFNRSGLNAIGYQNRADLKWSKMLTNLLGNATSAILNWTPAQIFSNPMVYWIEVHQIRETLAIMKRLNIHLVNLPGTPIKPLIQIINSLPLSLSRPISYLALGKGRGAKMPSFHIDLYSGQTRSEVTFLNGAVVRAGEKLGIATPVNQVLTKTLEDLAAQKIDKEEYATHPEILFSRIRELL
ncbi:MAG: ketopantoate reductase family protein [Anaerolineaceae bacterium]